MRTTKQHNTSRKRPQFWLQYLSVFQPVSLRKHCQLCQNFAAHVQFLGPLAPLPALKVSQAHSLFIFVVHSLYVSLMCFSVPSSQLFCPIYSFIFVSLILHSFVFAINKVFLSQNVNIALITRFSFILFASLFTCFSLLLFGNYLCNLCVAIHSAFSSCSVHSGYYLSTACAILLCRLQSYSSFL